MRRTNLYSTPPGRRGSTRSTVRCGHGANGTSTPTGTRLSSCPRVDYLRMSYYERWVHRLAAQVVKYGLVSQRGDRERKGGSGLNEGHSGVQPRDVRPLAQSGHCFEPGSKGSTVVQGAPARARPEHQSHWPHALAALRARQDRRHRPRSRRLSLSRHQRPFSGRETPARLLRPFPCHGSCGGRARHRATRCTSICGTTTLSEPEPTPQLRAPVRPSASAS